MRYLHFLGSSTERITLYNTHRTSSKLSFASQPTHIFGGLSICTDYLRFKFCTAMLMTTQWPGMRHCEPRRNEFCPSVNPSGNPGLYRLVTNLYHSPYGNPLQAQLRQQYADETPPDVLRRSHSINTLINNTDSSIEIKSCTCVQ